MLFSCIYTVKVALSLRWQLTSSVAQVISSSKETLRADGTRKNTINRNLAMSMASCKKTKKPRTNKSRRALYAYINIHTTEVA